jgi:hypothetical protein
VVYALTYIYSDEGREVFVKLAAWGSVALWWNRYMIYAYDMARHPDPTDPTGQRKQHLGADTPPLAAHLDAGWNLILIKNRYEYGDGWRVEWDILDMEGSPLPNLWYSTEPVE